MTKISSTPTIGIDLGDRKHAVCVLRHRSPKSKISARSCRHCALCSAEKWLVRGKFLRVAQSVIFCLQPPLSSVGISRCVLSMRLLARQAGSFTVVMKFHINSRRCEIPVLQGLNYFTADLRLILWRNLSPYLRTKILTIFSGISVLTITRGRFSTPTMLIMKSTVYWCHPDIRNPSLVQFRAESGVSFRLLPTRLIGSQFNASRRSETSSKNSEKWRNLPWFWSAWIMSKGAFVFRSKEEAEGVVERD